MYALNKKDLNPEDKGLFQYIKPFPNLHYRAKRNC